MDETIEEVDDTFGDDLRAVILGMSKVAEDWRKERELASKAAVDNACACLRGFLTRHLIDGEPCDDALEITLLTKLGDKKLTITIEDI